MRYTVRLSYDGADFSGWQIQPNAKSIQECLQAALSTLLGGTVSVTGAGRTDANVNAVNYLAHFDTAHEPLRDARTLCYKLNAILPPSIVVHEVLPAPSEDFNARFNATGREYKYFIHRHKDPFALKWSYWFDYDFLDVDAMNRAATCLLGTHDFACFQKKGTDTKTSICTVSRAIWTPYTPAHVREAGFTPDDGKLLRTICEGAQDDPAYLVFRICADRFLRNMVRAVVGTLLEIGRGKHGPDWMQEVMLSASRSAAGESVPGHALFFCGASYPKG